MPVAERRTVFSWAATLRAAKSWVTRRPIGSPELTTLQLDFIRTSEQEEVGPQNAERQRPEEIAAAQAAREGA
jgi:hypothetical protein